VASERRARHAVPFRTFFNASSIASAFVSALVAFVVVGVALNFLGTGEVPRLTVTTARLLLLATGLLSLALCSAMLTALSRKVSEPLRRFTRAAVAVSQGDFSVRLQPSTSGISIREADECIDAFNRMAAELEGTDTLRKDFVSNVSHEIKTPIGAITALSEMLMEEGLPEEERREYATLLNEEAWRLSRLCEGMLDLSRLENQSITAEPQAVAVDEQLRHAAAVAAERWSDRGPAFSLRLEPAVVYSVPDLLQQLWINLVDNAVKYSDPGACVYLAARREGDEVVVSVRDEGSGIPAEQQPYIFDRFYQGDKAHAKQGSGLGLSIVKRIADLLGATVKCESAAGVGTTMTVRIPAGTPASE
jgi:signal transduction histidine kinase